VAGLDEEIIFRLMGIAALLWLFPRRRWLALLVPGALWALAHLTYVRDPFYMRGVELLIVALFWGIIFLKFDLTTTIVAHATFNALLGALPMLRSGEPYYVFSGIVVILVLISPTLPGLILWLKKRSLFSNLKAPVIRLAEETNNLDWSEFQAGSLEDWDTYFKNPQAVVVCLEHNGKVIGAAAGLLDEDHQARILHVQVHPDWRNQYWGSYLVLALQEELKSGGASSVKVETNLQDRTSVAFWATQGWRPAKRTLAQAEFPTFSKFIRQSWEVILGNIHK
jgi:N-acetylglutamate synthase-like GNAT family acetyltransferase